MSGALAATDFTPFGYLRNPAHVARAWTDTRGGNVRTMPEFVGLEWVYPVGRDARQRVGVAIETSVDGRTCATRAEFDAIGLCSRYHTSSVIGFEWQLEGVHVQVRAFGVGDDALCLDVSVSNGSSDERHVPVRLVGRVDGGESISSDGVLPVAADGSVHTLLGSANIQLALPPGARQTLTTVVARGADAAGAAAYAMQARAAAADVLDHLEADDARFLARCPTLTGDWPAHWREGLHHDFQTTRLLVQPPGGIFQDVWPAWMAAWPRVVLAEGVLDMQRLAYVDADLAQRAVLSLFRDAPMPNVPCVFRGGEFNMVAADGSRCGTSPAWCLPLLNLELMYLRSLDRAWLARVFPYAAAYLRWWLRHRTDADGWLVYKCTWESGEDGNPRLDPSGSGDADISSRVRPVELQATMAHAANVMAFFADELGQPDVASSWRAVAAEYLARTRQLLDPAEGRFRDWLIAENRFQDPCADTPYWGLDACRFSAQSLTPLLLGEPLAAEEIWRHTGGPWTWWPSWTLALVESAAAAGHYVHLGRLIWDVIDRVYRVTTRRTLDSLPRPLPGSSPEFWPADWRTYAGNDAYGWGASTANLLLRHLIGFKESRESDGWVAELTPALPREALEPGGRYAVRHLHYRGLSFELAYIARTDGLQVELQLENASRACSVERLEASANQVYTSLEPSPRHAFGVELGQHYRLRLG